MNAEEFTHVSSKGIVTCPSAVPISIFRESIDDERVKVQWQVGARYYVSFDDPDWWTSGMPSGWNELVVLEFCSTLVRFSCVVTRSTRWCLRGEWLLTLALSTSPVLRLLSYEWTLSVRLLLRSPCLLGGSGGFLALDFSTLSELL